MQQTTCSRHHADAENAEQTLCNGQRTADAHAAACEAPSSARIVAVPSFRAWILASRLAISNGVLPP